MNIRHYINTLEHKLRIMSQRTAAYLSSLGTLVLRIDYLVLLKFAIILGGFALIYVGISHFSEAIAQIVVGILLLRIGLSARVDQ